MSRVKSSPPKKLRIRLADGKQRTIQHMSATSFWSPDGKPMSAAEFVENLFGDLPALFRNEDELREIWSKPETRKALLEGLEEKGYGTEQLREIGQMIDAPQSDLFDVLAYIAWARPPITRAERVESHRPFLFEDIDYAQKEFLEFVLDHYVERGVTELDPDKLPHLIDLKYHSVNDAVRELGSVRSIRQVFIDFQKRLY
ncbi:MAG: type I restriction-modification enzyme R subunit C-terminal domain-containing protein [Xanthomonadales bacterium]|nr:type I restriction-modification enzyme R subunit C-terminal domain-containing protein [Xanthomonadales bacterium]